MFSPGRVASSVGADNHSYLYVAAVTPRRDSPTARTQCHKDLESGTVSAPNGFWGSHDYETTHTSQTGKHTSSRVPYWDDR